ncbi:MAG: rRNA pseudouridine synthase [Verrucomicrobiales bacterium]|jgi:23S rRNA pseudouridine2605 synthase|nr:rRNA pseudouridine synthase [Verrucomicrobiales bacterium]
MIRLNKFLAAAGHGSRRSCDTLIRDGKVVINGKTVTNLATRVKPTDAVTVSGRRCRQEEAVYLLLNKPTSVVCSRIAQGRRRTVFDLVPEDLARLFYIGRLDLDSEGLLILTNDGDAAQKLTHPSHKLEKTYVVELDRDFDFELAPRFVNGFMIEGGYAKTEAMFKISKRHVKVILTQGLKRQIRLMFLKHGYKVKKLQRVQMGSLKLGKMRPGMWRLLTDDEIAGLKVR